MIEILHGDCIEQMRGMADGSVDAVVTDPPYELGFMGKSWDASGIANSVELWREAFRVLKPGGRMLAFGATRTFHRMVCAIEDAGFEINDTISWMYGTGFPKSRNVSKDLKSLATCVCVGAKVSNHLGGVVDAALPLSLGGAGIGTECVPVPLAGLAADGASGFGPQSGAVSLGRKLGVKSGVEQGGGHLGPVVLGALNVAGMAEGGEIAGFVGSVQVQPEALRNAMVDNEAVGGSALKTCAVSGDDIGCDIDPSAAFVLPFAATPSGVAFGGHPVAVVSGHAVSGTVGSGSAAGQGISSKLRAAVAAGEGSHGQDYTTERQASVKCSVCGGVIQKNIPEGLGTALKPAMELICVARKPLVGTVAQNVLEHGTGALNIDACRIGTGDDRTPGGNPSRKDFDAGWGMASTERATGGRFPANIIHDGSDEVLDAFAAFGESKSSPGMKGERHGAVYDGGKGPTGPNSMRGHADSGTAARFFYSAKASKADRAGSKHPTVKPVSLMRYLCKLVTPPGGTVLDPFAGSGTTGQAALEEGFRAVLIEQSEEYVADIRRRIAAAQARAAEPAKPAKAKPAKPKAIRVAKPRKPANTDIPTLFDLMMCESA